MQSVSYFAGLSLLVVGGISHYYRGVDHCGYEVWGVNQQHYNCIV